MVKRCSAWDDPPVSKRVLIVDDHPTFRAIARTVLSAGGFLIVGESADAASALTAARDLRPDCVLLDVQLGDADGFEVAEALTSEAGAPVVVLTSGRDAREIQPLVEASTARGFVPKELLSASALEEFLR
jgi:DNA-binding NarL/FixJ family response regulator